MMNPANFPVAVLGGGIVGLSIALSLQKQGVNVLLLDKQAVGSGASQGNAGHIATEQVFPIASPEVIKQLPSMLLDPLSPLHLDWRYLPKIAPWLMRLACNMTPSRFERIHQALRALNGASLPAWQNFAQQWQLTPLVKVEGSLLVAEKASSIASLRAHGDKLNRLGIRNQWLDKHSLQEREPALADTQLGALFYPDTGHVMDLNAMLASLLQSFIGLGGQVVEHVDIQHIGKEGQYWALQGNGQRFLAEQLVIATGAFSKRWAKSLAGVDVPLDTERGYHLMLPAMKNTLSVPVSSYDRKFIMTPMQGGLRLAGTVEYAGLEAAPNMGRAEQLATLAKPMLNVDLDSNGKTAWMGFRPSTADSLPVIDRKGSLYFAFGHQHLGLTQAPLTAQLVTELFFNRTSSLDLSPYRLNRF